MPRIRRWFHVSHDLNFDPEVWELTNRLGDRALRVWLEILSIADRNNGMVPGWLENCSPELGRALANRCRVTGQTVASCLRLFDEKLWTEPGTPHRVRNYAKYNVSREANQIPSGKHYFPNPPPPPLLSSPLKKKEEEEEEIFSSAGKQGNGIDTAPPVKHKRTRKKVKKEWPEDGFFIRDFLAQQTFFDSHFDPEVLAKIKDKLDDAQWWEDLSHAVNGLDGETLHRNFAAISVWMHDHPQRIPTARGLRSFIARWFQGAAEDERKKPWLIAKRAAKLLRR
jgi:hypothetical protein